MSTLSPDNENESKISAERKKEILSQFKRLLVKAARKERLKQLIETKRKEQGIDVNETPNNDSPFVPCSDDCIEQFIRITNPSRNDIIVDLGCGDARVLIAAAKKAQCKCIGIEIQSQVAQKARDNVQRNNLSHLIQIIECDFKSQQCGHILRKASIVFMFLLPKILPLVTNILLKYIQHKCRVVSYIFDLARNKNTVQLHINDWPYPTLGTALEYIENKGVFLRDIHPDLRNIVRRMHDQNNNKLHHEYELLSVNGRRISHAITNVYEFIVFKRYLHSVLAKHNQSKHKHACDSDIDTLDLGIRVIQWKDNYVASDLDAIRPAHVCEVKKTFKSGSEIRSDLKLYQFPLTPNDFGWVNPNSASRIVHAAD
eukprot:534066_1